MPEFENIREQLRQARDERNAAADKVRAARERLRRVANQQAESERVLNQDDPAHIIERQRLQEERKAAESGMKQATVARDRFAGVEAEALNQFIRFSDPRTGIEQLSDSTPILLMPVRLETRFKTVMHPDGGAPIPQLWLRIYPDDCWLDSFDPVLTETEVANAKTYWTAIAQAGGDEDLERAAWRALVTSHGSGRATWIVQTFVPTNPGASAAELAFPEIETKQSAWSHAPKCTLLPERFVFIGYEGTTITKVQIGSAVRTPLIAAPDPSAPKDEQLQHDAGGNLIMPEELKWIADFDRAVEVGMGMRIDLDPAQTARGFGRVLVIGLRLSADEQAGKKELETLFQHHAFTRTGFALVPQGTPTNNTEAVGSGHGRFDDPDDSFNDRKAPLFANDPDWLGKKDGQWLCEYLGLDPALFAHTHNAGCTDQLAARAMNIALWPATLGYWMEGMMTNVFSRDAIEKTREFFNRYVIASGAVPAIRIGNQPYGVLPATKFSQMGWLDQRLETPFTSVFLAQRGDSLLPYLRQLHTLLEAMGKDWDAMRNGVSFVGKAEADPHVMLLDIVGLHSGSVDWWQRYAESLRTYYNRLNLAGLGGFIAAIIAAMQRDAARALLTKLGHAGAQEPLILEKIFSGRNNHLTGGVADDQPLSETNRVRGYTPTGANYLQWLIDAANISLDALYKQEGFTDDKPPGALLYLLLRHALQLGYDDVSVRLNENAGILNAEQAMAARADDPFIHIRDNQAPSESRYARLLTTSAPITGNTTQTVSEFITTQIASLFFAFYLREQLAALERLKKEPTARLERAFADHVDCCSYRLDAWQLGLVNYQLALMRNLHDGSDVAPRQGIYLGAYAWLEELRPENKELTPVRLTDPDLIKDFGDPSQPPLMRDSTNQGYIHAPSLNHAVAAAVLRNGFISDASPQNRQTLAVNLTSERVRIALGMIEGIRAGQSMGDLLGYQFERGLHDRHNVAEVDKFILKLRKAFPLRADQLKATQTPEGVSIEAIEARNVIDGLKLVEHMIKNGKKNYPFGLTTLRDANQNEAAQIDAEAERLLDTHDAVADLALSEGVYQAVLGNYDRVAATYDAYARGNFPPEPDVIRTPLNGIGLTNRVAIHLRGGAAPNVSPLPGVVMTPRAQGEPALNEWVASVLPPLDQVGCVVHFFDAAAGAPTQREIKLSQLQLQPADLLMLIPDDARQEMTELDDRIVRFAIENFGPRPDELVSIRYMEKNAAALSIFELMPLARNLRRLTSKSRPLKATDLSLTNEARAEQDSAPFVDKARLDAVHLAMTTLRADITAFQSQLEVPLADLANRRAEILSKVDDYISGLVPLLARAALFAVSQAGWGFAYDFRRRVYAAILQQAAERAKAWDDRIVEFNVRMTDESALPGTATEQEHIALLVQADRAIAAVPTAAPVSVTAYRNDLLNVKLPAFTAKQAELVAVKNSTRTRVSLLLNDVRAILPLTTFDLVEFSLTPHEEEFIRFTQDAVQVLKVIGAELDRRLLAGDKLFQEHDDAAEPAAKVRALEAAAKILLSDAFRIFPEFTLAPAQGDEIENAINASRAGDLFQFLKNPPDPATTPLDFPVDTWLYGVARVREKMHAWEQTVVYAEALQVAAPPELEALQFPFIPGDRWLGLEFPPAQKLDKDRLLYTAKLPAAFDKTAPQCGLLVDEWTETIPTDSVDTGLTFHHDRPNCEAPQTMLLVTPSQFRGTWRWDDLVDALNETLELAKRRAIEPQDIDRTAYAPFLPATIIAAQVEQLTIAADLALNNRLFALAKN
jgi:hypothetical protein